MATFIISSACIFHNIFRLKVSESQMRKIIFEQKIYSLLTLVLKTPTLRSQYIVPDKCFPNAYVFSDYYPVKWMTLTPKLKTVCILATKNLFTYPYNLHSKYKKKFWLSWTPNTSNAFFPHSYECIIHVKALSRTHLIIFGHTAVRPTAMERTNFYFFKQYVFTGKQ